MSAETPTLDELLDAVVAGVKSKLTALKECKAHDGRFDLDELKAFQAQAPAVRLAVLGTRPSVEAGTGESDYNVIVAAYVVTRDAPGLPRGKGAMAIATALLALVPGNEWGLSVGPPRDVRAENLYSGKLQGTGLCLWGVTWLQPIRLGEDVWAEDGVFPPLAYARHDDGAFTEVAVDLQGAGDAP